MGGGLLPSFLGDARSKSCNGMLEQPAGASAFGPPAEEEQAASAGEGRGGARVELWAWELVPGDSDASSGCSSHIPARCHSAEPEAISRPKWLTDPPLDRDPRCVDIQAATASAHHDAEAAQLKLGNTRRQFLRRLSQRQRPVVVLLVGPAGSGKSVLARALFHAVSAQTAPTSPLLVPASSHAKTRAHGIAFVEAIRVPGSDNSSAKLPADDALASPSLVLLDTPGVVPPATASGGSEALEAWRQRQAETCLAKWLGEGAAQGDGVLLEPEPPLAHLLAQSEPTSPHTGARWTPDAALVVLSAEDVHQRLTGGAAQRTALENLVAVLMLRFRGACPPVVLTGLNTLSPHQQTAVRHYLAAAFGLAPEADVFSLPAATGSLAHEAALQALARSLYRCTPERDSVSAALGERPCTEVSRSQHLSWASLKSFWEKPGGRGARQPFTCPRRQSVWLRLVMRLVTFFMLLATGFFMLLVARSFFAEAWYQMQKELGHVHHRQHYYYRTVHDPVI